MSKTTAATTTAAQDTQSSISLELINKVRDMLNQLEVNLSPASVLGAASTVGINITTPINTIKAKRLCSPTSPANLLTTVRAESGVKGVHKHPSGKWCAKFYNGGVEYYVGLYVTINEAKKAIEAAKKEQAKNPF